eukprot:scaffold16492_cov72-Skeletonema_dohrnii-CCMP3373.AAC.6
MADNNSNTATVAQLLHSDSGKEEDGCGDIEQGRNNIIMSEHTDGLRSSSSLWASTAITGGKSANAMSTTTTKLPLPLGGLEYADVEDAAPVPLMQQIDDTELEEDNVAPIEDCSTTLQPQPPTQGAMMLEQIEDDDDAAPRPFTDFERESRLKIDLENISTDEEDGPPLPLTYQQDSL